MNRPGALLVSGWASAPTALDPLARALASSYDVKCTSVHHLAQAAATTDTGLSTYAAGLLQAVDEEQPALVLGWSMGGEVLLEALARRAGSVRHAALLNATARFTATADYACGLPASHLRALTRMLPRTEEEALDGFFRTMCTPADANETTVNKLVAEAHAVGSEELLRGLGYLETTDLRARLPEIRTPALLLHGAGDRIIPPSASRYLHQHLPHSVLHIEDEAGHDYPLLKSAEIARRLQEFTAA